MAANEFADDFDIMDPRPKVVRVDVEPVVTGGIIDGDTVGTEIAATGQVQGRSLTVRSKLGAELYTLIQRDLPKFYEVVRDSALNPAEDAFLPRDKYGNQSKSAGAYVSSARKMFIDLMKMANADVDVDEGGFKGDIEVFKKQLSGLSTQDLRDLTRMAPKIEES